MGWRPRRACFDGRGEPVSTAEDVPCQIVALVCIGIQYLGVAGSECDGLKGVWREGCLMAAELQS